MTALFQRHRVVTHNALPALVAPSPPKRMAATQRGRKVVVANGEDRFVQIPPELRSRSGHRAARTPRRIRRGTTVCIRTMLHHSFRPLCAGEVIAAR